MESGCDDRKRRSDIRVEGRVGHKAGVVFSGRGLVDCLAVAPCPSFKRLVTPRRWEKVEKHQTKARLS